MPVPHDRNGEIPPASNMKRGVIYPGELAGSGKALDPATGPGGDSNLIIAKSFFGRVGPVT